MSINFDKIKETISTPEGAQTFFTDIANALQVLVDLISKLFKAIAVKPRYAIEDDELYTDIPAAE